MRFDAKIIFSSLFLMFVVAVGSVLGQKKPNGHSTGYNFDDLSELAAFRQIPWGENKEFILANDPSPRKETGKDYLVLSGQLDDVNVDIIYFFWEGHFIKGTYVTTEVFADYPSIYEKYTKFKKLLSDKYGEAKIDIQNWNVVTYRDRRDRWLYALAKGHQEHLAFWQRERVIISIKLLSISERPSIKIEYYIEDIDRNIENKDDQDILRDL